MDICMHPYRGILFCTFSSSSPFCVLWQLFHGLRSPYENSEISICGIILISLVMHGEESNNLREQNSLIIAQLSTMDFCLMETLTPKRDIRLCTLKRRKLCRWMISFRLFTSFLHVKSGLFLPEEWNSRDWVSVVQRPHLSIVLHLWSLHGFSTSPFSHSYLCPS